VGVAVSDVSGASICLKNPFAVGFSLENIPQLTLGFLPVGFIGYVHGDAFVNVPKENCAFVTTLDANSAHEICVLYRQAMQEQLSGGK